MDVIGAKIIRGAKGMIRGTNNLIVRAMDKPLKPRWLVLMLTDSCNSRCRHCNIWQGKATKNPLTPNELRKVLSDPLFSDVEYILNTGGEPSLRIDLEQILCVEHEVLPKAGIQLSTNGLLPDRIIAVVNSLIRKGVKIDVGTSLDGVGEKHDHVRGIKGNFERVDHLLHELVKLRTKHPDKLDFCAQITVSDHTVDSVAEVRVYTKKLGVPLVEGWYNEAPFYNNAKESSISDKLSAVIKSQPDSLIKERWLLALNGKSIRFPCFAMYTFCVLKCNGDIVPCLTHWNTKAGNVRKSTPTEIWCSPTAKKARNVVKACNGCLNGWGTNWSFLSSFYPFVLFYLTHLSILKNERQKK